MLQISKIHTRMKRMVLYAFVLILFSIVCQEVTELHGLKKQREFSTVLETTSDLESLVLQSAFLTYHYNDSPASRRLIDERASIDQQLKELKKKLSTFYAQLEMLRENLSEGVYQILDSEPHSLRFVLTKYLAIEEALQKSFDKNQVQDESTQYLIAYSQNAHRGLNTLRHRLQHEASEFSNKLAALNQFLVFFNFFSIAFMGWFILYYLIKRLKEEQFLRRYSEIKLHDQIQELDRFAGQVAHDLKSPLHNIYLYSNMLLDSKFGENTELNREECLKKIITQSEKLSGMIHALLKFFKNSTKKVDKAKVRLRDLVRSAEGLLTKELESRQAAVICKGDIALYVDESLFLNIFQNMIQNTLKYSGVEKPVISFHGYRLGNYAFRIHVVDNGKGIEESERAVIFKPFKRGKSEKDTEGMGMGLSIAHRIVRWHGGKIEARNSSETGGAEFIITIPNLR